MNVTDENADLEAFLYHRHDRVTERPPNPGRDLTIRTDDGASLAATVFEADRRGPRRVVVIASGTGVPRRFYAPFARWLASGIDEEAATVVTFDYRGIGGSRAGTEAQGGEVAHDAGDATMHAWGERDLAAVVAWAGDVLGDGSVAVVGHSVGGQLIGLLPDSAHARIDSIVTIGAQSGDFRLWPMPMRLAMAAIWYGVVPGVTRAMGYLPGSLGVGEDLPPGVALEWARWCRTPGYLVGDGSDDVSERRRAGFARVTAPLLAFGFDDDTYAPPAAVDALLELFVSAKLERRRIGRDEGRFGHFGFFRAAASGGPRASHRPLWREVARHLRGSGG